MTFKNLPHVAVICTLYLARPPTVFTLYCSYYNLFITLTKTFPLNGGVTGLSRKEHKFRPVKVKVFFLLPCYTSSPSSLSKVHLDILNALLLKLVKLDKSDSFHHGK